MSINEPYGERLNLQEDLDHNSSVWFQKYFDPFC